MPLRSGGPAPYAPPQTVLTLIRTYRSRGLQTPFTPDVLQRAGVPDTLLTRVTQSLKLLDLIDESNNPTTEFEALRRAGDAEFPERLAALVRSAYAEVFKFVDPAKDGDQRVRDAFRAFEPLGQLTRMVTLFLAMCEAAAIIPEGTRKPAPARPGVRRPAAPTLRTADGALRRTGTLFDGSVRHDGKVRYDGGGAIPPALQGLIANLPPADTGWTETQRDRWIAAVTATVNFAIPVHTADEIAAAKQSAKQGTDE